MLEFMRIPNIASWGMAVFDSKNLDEIPVVKGCKIYKPLSPLRFAISPPPTLPFFLV